MFSRRRTRLTALAGAAVLVLGLAPASSADHARPPGPVNAQTTYDWGKPQWQDDFVGPMKDIWRVKGPGVVQTQHGMLTLNTAKRRTVSATLKGKGHDRGRWEIRLRSRWYESDHSRYRVRTELIPAGDRKQHCGARDIALESYKLGGRRAHSYIRTLPDNSFNDFVGLNLGKDQWHTFAIEVRPKRISWYVDAHVVMTERRPAALSGVPLTVRFSMVAPHDQRMNQSRMQMDWLRYFTLEKRNNKSIEAPRGRRTTYRDAC